MGRDRRLAERDTRDREARFARLQALGQFLKGVREREPLRDGVEDEA